MNKVNKEAMTLNLLYREFPESFVWLTSYKCGHVANKEM